MSDQQHAANKKARISMILGASATLAVKTKMKALAALGVKTIGLGAGELKFPLAAHIRKSAKYLAARMSFGYTDAPGTEVLRETLRFRYLQKHGVEYDPKTQIMTTAGGKGALEALYDATFADKDNPDYDGRDEVIAANPHWLSHGPLIKKAGGKMVGVDCPAENGYKITPEQLRAAITDKTKYVLLSGANPGGSDYTADELKALAEVLRENPHVVAVSEDMYEDYTYDGKPRAHLLDVAPDLADQTVCINCVSKSDEMAGERLGWIVGPADIMKLKGLASNTKGNSPVFGQWLTVSAMMGHEYLKRAYRKPQEYIERLRNPDMKKGALPTAREAFNEIAAKRQEKIPKLKAWRDAVLEKFKGTKLKVPDPKDAIYVYPDAEVYIGMRFDEDMPLAEGLDEEKMQKLGLQSFAGKEIKSGQDLVDAFIVHGGVGVVPGAGFGNPNNFRIAFVEASAEEGAERVAKVLSYAKPQNDNTDHSPANRAA